MPGHFPDDENGDALRRMEQTGDDLNVPRDINFSVVFPSVAEAEEFAVCVRERGLTATIEKSNCVPELPWDVTVTKHMIPKHAEINDTEEMLESLAGPLGGHNDGWGCFSQQVEH